MIKRDITVDKCSMDQFKMKTHESVLKPGDSIVANEDTGSGAAELSVAGAKLKKPYKAPQITEYGSVTRLTAGVKGSSSDMGNGMRRRFD